MSYSYWNCICEGGVKESTKYFWVLVKPPAQQPVQVPVKPPAQQPFEASIKYLYLPVYLDINGEVESWTFHD